ncbi:MAG: PH domain-containing protein [Thermoflexales bacterium]|nr:PH domain-containing protein [Thermoflexales bacterium]
MSAPSTQVLIEQAKQAKRLNDLPRVRSLLSQAIKTDPRNEDAWLMFAEVAEKPEHAIYSLEQVLKINPVNMGAVDQLNALKTPPPAPAPRPATPVAVNRAPVQPIVVPPVQQEPEREKVILEKQMHGTVFVLPLLIAAMGVVFAVVMGKSGGQTYAIIAILGGLLILLEAVIEFLKLAVRFAANRLTLTTKRIIINRGLFNRSTFEVFLTQVEGVGIKRNFLGSLLGFGTIIITGTGGARQVFSGIHAPEAFRERVQAEIAASQWGKS